MDILAYLNPYAEELKGMMAGEQKGEP